jgi:hypothetical protein
LRSEPLRRKLIPAFKIKELMPHLRQQSAFACLGLLAALAQRQCALMRLRTAAARAIF